MYQDFSVSVIFNLIPVRIIKIVWKKIVIIWRSKDQYM